MHVHIGKIMSIGKKWNDTKNIEIFDLLNPQIKYEIWAQETEKDTVEGEIYKSKLYSMTIGDRNTYIHGFDSDGLPDLQTAKMKPGVNQPRDFHSCAKMSFNGKTILVAAGGVGKSAPFPKLRSVEILDISSLPNPEWTYGKI